MLRSAHSRRSLRKLGCDGRVSKHGAALVLRDGATRLLRMGAEKGATVRWTKRSEPTLRLLHLIDQLAKPATNLNKLTNISRDSRIYFHRAFIWVMNEQRNKFSNSFKPAMKCINFFKSRKQLFITTLMPAEPVKCRPIFRIGAFELWTCLLVNERWGYG